MTITTAKGRSFKITDERHSDITGTTTYMLEGVRGAKYAMTNYGRGDIFQVWAMVGTRLPFSQARRTDTGWEVVA